jgi:hypothetical protein
MFFLGFGLLMAEKAMEHEFARVGEWSVSYFTNEEGKSYKASTTCIFENGTRLRFSLDAGNYYIDMSGEWKATQTAKNREGNNVPVTIALDEQRDDDGLVEMATLIDEDGDKWLRITQAIHQPGGLEEAIRNGKVMHVIFSEEAKWTFSLDASHAAREKLQECIDKHGPAPKE